MDEPEEIHVLNKQVRLLQPADGFRTSLDSVILAAACPARPGDHILDLGTGVGGAGLCVLFRIPDTKLTGIDIQNDHIELAVKNAALNGMEGRASFTASDICDYNGPRFDHVIINPPYLEAGAHLLSPQEKKAIAHGHSETTLKDWLKAAFTHLKSGGSLTIIHRADQIDKIIQGLGKSYGAIEIIPLWPRLGVQAKRVILRAIKDRHTPTTLHAGLILHQDNGEYTAETEVILRKAAKLL